MKYIFIFLALIKSSAAFCQMQLNSSFGNNGVVKIALDDFTEPVSAIRVNGDSLLLLANVTHNDTAIATDFAVVKLTADGVVDPAFGQGGSARYDFDNMDVSSANSFLALDDGKLLVLGSGHAFNNANFIPACLMKLFADGKVDSSFGNNGTLQLQFDGIEEFPRVLKKATGGKFIVGGFSTDSMHMHVDVPAIARMNENGTLDSTFGEDGKVYLRFPNGVISASRHIVGGVLYDILELGNGSYLASGGYSNGLNLIGFITHLNHDGSVDTSFVTSGYLALDFTPFANSQIVKMKQDAGGLVWFGATSASTQGRDFFIGNLNLLTNDFNTANVDFNGYEDVFADIQFDTYNNPFFIGKSISPNHTSAAWQSDYFAIDFSPASVFPFNGQKFTFSEDTTLQCGAVSSISQTNGNLICYGFKNKPNGENELMLIALDVSQISSVAEEKKGNIFLSVFPNPTHGIINVLSPDGQSILNIQLYDCSGKLVNSFSAGAAAIDVSDLSAGAYLLRATVDGKNFTSRVVIE